MVDLGSIASQVKAALNTEALVGRYIELRPAGPQRRVGLCPFHTEKNPSFFVNVGGRWGGRLHCFGCQWSGDVIQFYMQVEGLSFPEALRRLADEAGLPWPTEPRRIPQERAEAARIDATAEILARDAGWWYDAILEELAAGKVEATAGEIVSFDAMIRYSRELRRFEALGADGIIREFLDHRARDPQGCAALIQAARRWESDSQAVVRAVLDRIERDQRSLEAHGE